MKKIGNGKFLILKKVNGAYVNVKDSGAARICFHMEVGEPQWSDEYPTKAEAEAALSLFFAD